MSEVIQSLSICCPSASGKCINHCKTCTARQHDNPYKDLYDGTHVENFEYWDNVFKRMKHARDKGCTTLMLTGSNEPQQNRRWLETLYPYIQMLPSPFVNIEIQTTGALMDKDYVEYLKRFGVTTVALSAFNIFDDDINRDIEESADKNLSVDQFCKWVTDAGMNLRICLNVTDKILFDGMSWGDSSNEIAKRQLARCAALGASQVTFRKMWFNPGTPEAKWIKAHTKHSDDLLNSINSLVRNEGRLINVLPYGAARFDYLGFSIVIDMDSMAKDETNTATKYYIIREDGKMYSSWDSKASIVF